MSLFRPRQPYTLRSACADALADAFQTLRAPQAYRAHIPHLLSHFGEDTALGTITHQDIEAYQITALDRWTRNTVRHHIAFLSRTFRLAERCGKVDRNPCRLVRKPRPGDARRVWLTLEQVHKVMAAFRRPEDRFNILFFLYSGCRKMEGFDTLRTDINFERHELHVSPAKSGRPRWIPIKPEFSAILQEVMQSRQGPYLLQGGADRAAAGNNFYARFKYVMRKLGMGHVVLHDLRRSTACWLLKEGVDISTIRDWLGHSSLAVTEIYARVESGNMHRAARKMAWVGDDCLKFKEV